MKITLVLLTVSVLVGCSSHSSHEAVDTDTYYTCSMDPQVVESKPGNCPICKMPLTAIKKSRAGSNNEVSLSDQQIELGNISTDTLREALIGEDLILTGRLVWDENNVQVVSSRAAGRIDKLFIKTVGETVENGQPLYMFYSQAINTAVKEYSNAVDRRTAHQDYTQFSETIIRAAYKKLRLYGLSEKQISSISERSSDESTIAVISRQSGVASVIYVREGDYVEEGASIMKIVDPNTLWAEAEVYPDDLKRITETMKVSLVFPGIPSNDIQGRIMFVEPETNSRTRITKVRVGVDNSMGNLRPGMQVDIIATAHLRRAATLPIDAVIHSKAGASVWIEVDDNIYRNVMVTTGAESFGKVEITSGVTKGDVVVVSGSYLVNSEYLMKYGVVPMADHKHD